MLYTALQILDGTYKFKTGTQEGEINGLKKVNIFVGQNNSGKSRFMRSIFANKNSEQSLIIRDYWMDKYLDIYDNSLVNYINSLPLGINPNDELKSLVLSNKLSSNGINVQVSVEGQASQHLGIHRLLIAASYISKIQDPEIRKLLESIKIQIGSDISDPNPIRYEFHTKVVYIPLLRGLKNPDFKSSNNEDVFAERAIYDYFIQPKSQFAQVFANMRSFIANRKFEIFSGLALYDEIKRMLLGNHEQREIVRNFELFLSENFFNNLRITLTPHIDDDVLYIKIGEGKDYPIYDLGDGIQSIIICTFPLFKYKDENALFFIEEPEIGIHPGMQRILLETFTKGVDQQGGKHQIFFTTHSNHLLDIALDEDISKEISIYQFRDYLDEKHITNISQNKEVLDLLGARNSSIFLSNCIIWVEGISDRIYIKKWLSLYFEKKSKIKFEEDKHFSILEYGGGNVVHFNFSEEDTEDNINVQGINKNNFIIADNDGYSWRGSINPSDPEKAKRLKFLYKELGADNFFCDLREIENGLGEIWLKRFIDSCNFFKKRISVNHRTTSIDWNMSMGDILRKHFLKKDGRKKLKYFDDQDHIEVCSYSKVQVAESINNMDDLKFDDLPKITQNLVKKLYEFIKANNSN